MSHWLATLCLLAAAGPPPPFSVWKAIGCFFLGFLWLTFCGLIGRAMGGKGCWGAVVGLFFGFCLLFAENGILTWNRGHQIAFWVGLGIAFLISVLVSIAVMENQ